MKTAVLQMRRRAVPWFTLAGSLLAVDCHTHRAAAEDWYRWRGPNLNGISSEVNWNDSWNAPDGPPILWKANVGTGFSSVAASDGRAFTIGNVQNTDTVYCLDAETGSPIWKHHYACPLDDKFFDGGPTSTPTVDGDAVFTLSRQGDLFCFDAATGHVRWSKNIARETGAPVPGWGFAASPLVHGELLLLGVGEAGTAVDKRTGDVVWKSDAKEAGYATPQPFRHGDKWFVLIASGKYYQTVDLATGEPWWRLRWLTQFGCNAADPIVADNQIFLSSGYNRGSALLRLTDSEPEIVWKSKEYQNQFSSSVLLDGFLYGVDGDTTSERTLECVELATGKIRWSAEGVGSGALMAANRRLIILSESGELIIAEATPESYRPISRAQVLQGKCWTVPVLAGGRIYCRSAQGELVCVDVRR